MEDSSTENQVNTVPDEATEATPLLTTASPAPASVEDEAKPMKKGQIIILCLGRTTESISFFCIVPFINQMIENTGGVEFTNVGFYSGLIESLFSLVQMIVMIPWGKCSDRKGRKPVLVTSLFMLGLTTCVFGLAQSLWQMILFRILAGASAGTLVTIRTMLVEISTRQHEARAFSLFAFFGNLGIFLGPLLGGLLSRPAENWPKWFGNVEVLRKFPYFLPCFLSGSFAIVVAIVNFFFLEETLISKKTSNDAETVTTTPQPPRLTTWQVLKSQGVISTLIVYHSTIFLGLAYTAVIPLCWYTPIQWGGLSFSERQIGSFLMLSGLSQAFWLLVIFPPFHKRVGGTGPTLRLMFLVWPLFLLSPILLHCLRQDQYGNVNETWTFFVPATVMIVMGSGVSMAFTSIQLALNEVNPSPLTLGMLNGIALSMSSGIRSIVPATFTTLYAVGIKHQIVAGQIVWIVLASCAAVMGVRLWTYKLKHGRDPWQIEHN